MRLKVNGWGSVIAVAGVDRAAVVPRDESSQVSVGVATQTRSPLSGKCHVN